MMFLLLADFALTAAQYVGLTLLVALLYPLYLFMDYALFQPYRRYRVLALRASAVRRSYLSSGCCLP